MFTQTATIDSSIHEHLDSLGLFSLSSYKLWCKRSGFSMSLEKSASELQTEFDYRHAEIEPSDPRIHKNHSPRRADYIERIATGEFDGQPLSSMMSWIRKLFDEVNDVEGAHDALLRFLLVWLEPGVVEAARHVILYE